MSKKNPLGGRSDEEIWARGKDAEAIEKMRQKQKKDKEAEDKKGDDKGAASDTATSTKSS